MASWMSLVVLSVVSAIALGLPQPDRYQIPEVGNNQRSQYYVLHDDGSYKYGFDTGEDAFESQKMKSDGEVEGKFGYKDEDGQEFRVLYTSGPGGFVAQGDHLPQVHPDVTAAFAAARSSGPFEDPLAGAEGDRSYNFDFDGEDHSRNEVSDSDGIVTGSYSYVDEFGRTRSYTYRAGKGIGFVIEGDDLPQQVQPLPAHTTTTQFGGSQRTGSQRSQTRTSGQRTSGQRTSVQRTAAPSFNNIATSVRKTSASSRRSGSRQQQIQPAQTFFPQQSTQSYSSSSTRSSGFNAGGHSHSVSSAASRPAAATRTAATTNNFEAANTRSSQSPSGSYSIAYETSSHTRQEAGDDDNNVRGKFTFVADDDSIDRSIKYEAGSATGFIAEGAHLPIGPIVPGAPTGQVTGRIIPVVQTPFVDPLAQEDMDASYSFGFESDGYSRSEVADEDGNVSGTYTILGEDNILRTYRFRAGKGIGFELEEVSARPGNIRSQGARVATTGQQISSTSSGVSRGASSHGASSQRTSFAHKHRSSSNNIVGSSQTKLTPATTTYSLPQRGQSSRHSAQPSAYSASSDRHSNTNRASFKTSRENEISPGFTLRQYEASEGHGKYGYVLKFDD